MKVTVAILFTVLAVSANADMWDNIDWDKVVPVQDMPGFWDGRDIKPMNIALRGRTSRIVGGEIATPHQFPYQIALLTSFTAGTGLCGGSIISPVRFFYKQNVIT